MPQPLSVVLKDMWEKFGVQGSHRPRQSWNRKICTSPGASGTQALAQPEGPIKGPRASCEGVRTFVGRAIAGQMDQEGTGWLKAPTLHRLAGFRPGLSQLCDTSKLFSDACIPHLLIGNCNMLTSEGR